jgi:hypothetical protein
MYNYDDVSETGSTHVFSRLSSHSRIYFCFFFFIIRLQNFHLLLPLSTKTIFTNMFFKSNEGDYRN